jgi:hypothetical protein
VGARYDAVDTSRLGPSLRSFIGDAARIVALGQGATAQLSRGYLRAAASQELRRSVDLPPAVEANAGTTADGRTLSQAFGKVAGQVFLALRGGRPLSVALGFGRSTAVRFAQTETLDAARIELVHQAEAMPQIRGWRWRSRGTCEACLALDDGDVHGGLTFPAHPGCECVPEVVFSVPETVTRDTGHDRFNAMVPEEQDRLLGPVIANLIRAGAIAWADLVLKETFHDWRAVATTRPVEELLRIAS